MTAREAAEILGYHPRHIRWLCKQGHLQARIIGRDWHITPASVVQYAEKKTKERLPTT